MPSASAFSTFYAVQICDTETFSGNPKVKLHAERKAGQIFYREPVINSWCGCKCHTGYLQRDFQMKPEKLGLRSCSVLKMLEKIKKKWGVMNWIERHRCNLALWNMSMFSWPSEFALDSDHIISPITERPHLFVNYSHVSLCWIDGGLTVS